MEDDAYRTASFYNYKKFQSTSPVWRTTSYAGIEDFTKVEISIHVPRVEDDFVKCGARANYVDFNPRPPCGGRRRQAVPRNSRRVISIHVPRVEDDWANGHKPRQPKAFQSTSPVWRTTTRTGKTKQCTLNFNPRPPCGGRRLSSPTRTETESFQSTSPVWRTPYAGIEDFTKVEISIHVPRVEDDV